MHCAFELALILSPSLLRSLKARAGQVFILPADYAESVARGQLELRTLTGSPVGVVSGLLVWVTACRLARRRRLLWLAGSWQERR